MKLNFESLIKKALEKRYDNANLEKEYLPFRSEADLQFTLGQLLQQENPELGIHFEYKPCVNDKFLRHPIDIVLIEGGKKYAIELKYSAWNNKECIAGTSASHKCPHGFLYDIKMIEHILDGEKDEFEKGFCLFLTNNDDLCSKCENEDHKSKDIEIYHGRKIISGESLKYRGNDKSVGTSFEFKRDYDLKWIDIPSNSGEIPPFKLLIVEVDK